jgi:hypothetical protein
LVAKLDLWVNAAGYGFIPASGKLGTTGAALAVPNRAEADEAFMPTQAKSLCTKGTASAVP